MQTVSLNYLCTCSVQWRSLVFHFFHSIWRYHQQPLWTLKHNNKNGCEFQLHEILSHEETRLYSDTDEVNSRLGNERVRRTKGETKKLWWTSGDSGQRKSTEWTALVPEDSPLSWSFLVQSLQSPAAQRRSWRPAAKNNLFEICGQREWGEFVDMIQPVARKAEVAM